jgi:8-oxo-dGTP diphosphatase
MAHGGKVPLLMVDAIVEAPGRGVLLVERRYPPPGWALPGGRVEYGETVEAAVAREVLEETGLRLTTLRQFHVYSDPARDPRGHAVTVVFSAQAEGEPRGGDDARTARFHPWERLPPLAFDHARILADYRRRQED